VDTRYDDQTPLHMASQKGHVKASYSTALKLIEVVWPRVAALIQVSHVTCASAVSLGTRRLAPQAPARIQHEAPILRPQVSEPGLHPTMPTPIPILSDHNFDYLPPVGTTSTLDDVVTCHQRIMMVHQINPSPLS
jgi:hypothetical protein